MTDPRKGQFGSAGRKAGALGRSASALIAALLVLGAFAVVATGCGSDDPPAGEHRRRGPSDRGGQPRGRGGVQPAAQARADHAGQAHRPQRHQHRRPAARDGDPRARPGARRRQGGRDRQALRRHRADAVSTGIAIFESEIRNAALSYGSGRRASPVRTRHGKLHERLRRRSCASTSAIARRGACCSASPTARSRSCSSSRSRRAPCKTAGSGCCAEIRVALARDTRAGARHVQSPKVSLRRHEVEPSANGCLDRRRRR